MRLKKLLIHGFKSFADRVEISFENGITGVVGPNGCGKSNIGDAVRWVLGEQSAKQLRGSKMEDVIFNGTDKRRRLGYCEVTLIFDNEDHTLPIDFTEVSITRRAYRSGEGEYQINHAPCRLKDIIDLFRDTGTGRDGYSIIGQGRVDEILSQKTEERRQVFEEAAGIVKYKSRKLEAERRLENTQSNLDRVNDIVQDLEDRLEPLRLQSEDARRYLALREELKGLELNAFLLRDERYRQRIEELNETSGQLTGETEQNEAARTELDEQREKVQSELEKGEILTAGLREQVQSLIARVEADEGSAGVLRERLIGHEKERLRLEAEKTAAEEGESGLDGRIELLRRELESRQSELVEKQKEAAVQEEILLKEEQALTDTEEKAEQAKESVINAMNALGDVRSEQARLFALGQAIDTQIGALSTAYESSREETERLTRARDEAKDIFDEEKKRLDALNEDSRQITEQTRRIGEEYDRVTGEGNRLLSERQELGSRLKLLKEMQRDYEGYNLSVKQVLKEAERLGGAGVHGVVANIIHADARIEKAVETALGAALQNIITDTEEDAHFFIDYLKRERCGRATFLPISAVHGRTLDPAERRLLSMPGCIGVASEMVRFDEKYRGIAESLLGRTVIAENLTLGIPIHRAGRQSFRLVTLDGDVMNVGGSMTGGSTQSRMTSLLSREREITETTEKVAGMNQKLASLQSRMQQLGLKRAELKSQRQEAFDALHQQEIALTRAESHLGQAESELNAHETRSDSVKNEVENLKEQKAAIARDSESLLTRKTDGENASRLMREEATRLQNELNVARPRVSALRDAVTALRVQLTAAEKDVEMRSAELQRLTDRRGDTARILSAAVEGLRELAQKTEADEAQLRSTQTALGIARQSLDAARADFDTADKARLAAQESLRAINSRMDELTAAAEELANRAHHCEMLLQRVQSDLDNLTARIWEDYQLTNEGALPFKTEDFKLNEGEKRISAIKNEIKSLGSVNVSAMDEYREVTARYEELSTQKTDLEKAKEDLENIISELSGRMEKQFKAQFEQLDVYFGQTFTQLFGGGVAHLSLEDPSHALTSGIEIVAQPPGKKLQLLSLLSGGERALTAIAILFAMLRLKPTPFCILDEIEAALDDANIDNFAEYLKTYSVKTQFVVVTHRKGTMTRCDALYGVAMEEKGVSKLVSVKLSEAEE